MGYKGEKMGKYVKKLKIDKENQPEGEETKRINDEAPTLRNPKYG